MDVKRFPCPVCDRILEIESGDFERPTFACAYCAAELTIEDYLNFLTQRLVRLRSLQGIGLRIALTGLLLTISAQGVSGWIGYSSPKSYLEFSVLMLTSILLVITVAVLFLIWTVRRTPDEPSIVSHLRRRARILQARPKSAR